MCALKYVDASPVFDVSKTAIAFRPTSFRHVSRSCPHDILFRLLILFVFFTSLAAQICESTPAEKLAWLDKYLHPDASLALPHALALAEECCELIVERENRMFELRAFEREASGMHWVTNEFSIMVTKQFQRLQSGANIVNNFFFIFTKDEKCASQRSIMCALFVLDFHLPHPHTHIITIGPIADPRRFFRRGAGTRLLNEARQRKRLVRSVFLTSNRLMWCLQDLRARFGDILVFRGRAYEQKMQHDYSGTCPESNVCLMEAAT
jgi:hypothetical protein